MKLELSIEHDKISYQSEDGMILATLAYKETDTNITIYSINVNEVLRGKGIAGELMAEMSKISEGKAKKINPICNYAQKWLERNN